MGCCDGKNKVTPIKSTVPQKSVKMIKGRPVYLLKKRTSK